MHILHEAIPRCNFYTAHKFSKAYKNTGKRSDTTNVLIALKAICIKQLPVFKGQGPVYQNYTKLLAKVAFKCLS